MASILKENNLALAPRTEWVTFWLHKGGKFHNKSDEIAEQKKLFEHYMEDIGRFRDEKKASPPPLPFFIPLRTKLKEEEEEEEE